MKGPRAGGTASPPPPWRLVALMCLAEVLSMTGFSAYPALLPALRDAWGLSNSQAGLIGGAFFGGYMLAVPVLTSLTDRVDSRRVYLFAAGLAAAGAFGFVVLARGLWSAALLQAVAGAGLAGTYMPGLKALSDRVEGPRQSRFVAFYTATFGLGTSVSLLLAGALDAVLGWRWAFGVAAFGPLAAGALVVLGLPPGPPQRPRPEPAPLLDFRPVFRNRAARGYMLGYAAHCWELFGLRSWMVAYFAFSANLHSSAAPGSAAALAALINLFGMPASILGNELAVRRDRWRTVSGIMLASGLLACVVGFASPLPAWLVVCLMTIYFVVIMGDSAALTAGVVAAAVPGARGATMAMHSFLGFGAGFLGPVVFGAVLDAAGGGASVTAWGFAFASLGAGGIAVPLALGAAERLHGRGEG